ncbi:MAG: M12 family metallo-peptidase [Flavobacterium sp.]|uniref:M12 family metallo-peptidase n=1 Tax=Flavobacterium sp. TaxID=239 RepID=UPI0032660202
MKIKLLLLLFFCSNFIFAQHNTVGQKIIFDVQKNLKFNHFSFFTPIEKKLDERISKIVTQISYAKLNYSVINNIVSNKQENIEIEIPYLGKNITVLLYKANIFQDGFHIDTNVEKNIAYSQGVHYRGIIKEDLNSLVSFNFFENECNGIISSSELGNVIIGKAEMNKSNSDYVIYSDSDLKISNISDCATKDVPSPSKNNLQTNKVLSAKCTSIYFEIENDIYVASGSSTTTTANWMTSVFNNVQTIFNNDGITTAIKSLYIWTSPDPYTGATSTDYLYQFNNIRPIFDGDLGQLIGIDGGLGGVAITINGLCSTNNFSYSSVDYSYNNFPTYSWTVQVITHELGHLFGSPHTHGCYWNGNNTSIDGCGQSRGYSEGTCAEGPIPSAAVKGTIMSYCHLVSGVGISFNNGFGPQPTARILTAVGNSTCLSNDCINTCVNTITSSSITNVTDTSAIVSWTELGGTTQAQVSVFPFSSSPSVWVTPNANTYTATGLTPNTYYKAIVRNSCSSGLEAPGKELIFATNGDFCSGIPLTDTGGVVGNYTDNETITRVIIPSNPFAKAKITFTSFNLELDYDYLHIYNGSNDTYPELSGTTGFTGNIIPAAIESTASDGALTLKFISDGGVVAAGYEGTVSCATLGVNQFFDVLDFSFYPNPTKDFVNISSKVIMDEILIYNIQGQLLRKETIKSTDTKINLSGFASGTYFFKLKVAEKQLNFKVIKI